MADMPLLSTTPEIISNGHQGNSSFEDVSNGHLNSTKEHNGLEVSEDHQKSRRGSTYRFMRLTNISSGHINVDTLHTKSSNLRNGLCIGERCLGSIMYPPSNDEAKRKEHVISEAEDFINQYYAHIRRVDTSAHKERLNIVRDSIEQTGTYTLTETELILGAKTAWRNASRCIGRIQWTRLQVFDCRDVQTAQDMFNAICKHLSYATNKGNIRSAITVFPPRQENGGDFRVWNQQLISYAGYKQEDGSVIGDPINAEFTEICQRMGWKGCGGQHDVLPLILQSRGEDPKLFEIPKHLVLEVDIEHPRYSWFKELKFKWYAVPLVSALLLDVGGIKFPAIPFNGWYMGTEIGARDMCDPHRYNMTPKIAKLMGLDVTTNVNLWKDQALLDANIAVLYSFQKNHVSIVDHHTASESFIKHSAKEQRLRGGCPADWVWVVPPISGSVTPVFHQEMLNYHLKPSYEYQSAAWINYKWKDDSTDAASTNGHTSFKGIATVVRLSANLMGKAMANRIKATILYATETGKSETYARILQDIFNHAFNAKVICMDDYDVTHLEHETLLLVVTSTFGHGDPPENGEAFGRYLMNTTRCNNDVKISTQNIDSTQNIGQRFSEKSSPKRPSPPSRTSSGLLDYNAGILENVRFSVFAHGSQAYPKFAAFGRALDVILEELGGERITSIGLGDELSGQEQSFKEWAMAVFKTACDVFCVGEGVDLKKANAQLIQGDQSWTEDRFRITIENKHTESDLCPGLSQVHKKTILPSVLKRRRNLQPVKSEEPCTILVELDTQGAEELLYSPGDHVGICPANEKELVDRILKRVDMKMSHDAVVKCEFLEKKSTPIGIMKVWNATSRLPPCSLRDALTRYLDITSPPSQHFLHMMSTQATYANDQSKLMALSENHEEHEDWRFDERMNLAEVLDQFPSVKLSPSFLLTELPILKPRFYSISSSLKMHQGEIHMTVHVVNYRVGKYNTGSRHNGVCSSYLNRIDAEETVPAFIRRAPLFDLPQESDCPVIMVGPGTGIAPFRGFWQDRLIDIQMKTGLNKTFGSMTLVFGCRKSVPENIYNLEIEAAKQQGALTDVWIAFSREPNVQKTYVQDILRKRSAEVFRLIDEFKGHFYVCGDIKMAAAVEKTLEGIISIEGKITSKRAKAYISHMRNRNVYHEDIFGVTLRTREVHTDVRRQTTEVL